MIARRRLPIGRADGDDVGVDDQMKIRFFSRAVP
jgi:hypothetical protein